MRTFDLPLVFPVLMLVACGHSEGEGSGPEQSQPSGPPPAQAPEPAPVEPSETEPEAPALDPDCWTALPDQGVALPDWDPEGIRVGPDCALYVATANTIWRIDPALPAPTVFAESPVDAGFQGIEWGPDGLLYVASRSAEVIVRFDGDGAFVDVFANTTPRMPNTPRFGPDGRLYVSSRNDASVVVFEADGSYAGVFTSHPMLGSPEGIAFGPGGDLYVSSRESWTVSRFDGATGAFVEQVAGPGDIAAPEGLVFDSDGDLWIASRDDHRVLELDGSDFEVLRTVDTMEGRPIGLERAPDGGVLVGLRDLDLIVEIAP